MADQDLRGFLAALSPRRARLACAAMAAVVAAGKGGSHGSALLGSSIRSAIDCADVLDYELVRSRMTAHQRIVSQVVGRERSVPLLLLAAAFEESPLGWLETRFLPVADQYPGSLEELTAPVALVASCFLPAPAPLSEPLDAAVYAYFSSAAVDRRRAGPLADLASRLGRDDVAEHLLSLPSHPRGCWALDVLMAVPALSAVP